MLALIICSICDSAEIYGWLYIHGICGVVSLRGTAEIYRLLSMAVYYCGFLQACKCLYAICVFCFLMFGRT